MADQEFQGFAEFEAGDVVFCTLFGRPHGFAVVCGAERKPGVGLLLWLHGGQTWKTCYYLNSAFCLKVGRVTPNTLLAVVELHEATERHDAEREARAAQGRPG